MSLAAGLCSFILDSTGVNTVIDPAMRRTQILIQPARLTRRAGLIMSIPLHSEDKTEKMYEHLPRSTLGVLETDQSVVQGWHQTSLVLF